MLYQCKLKYLGQDAGKGECFYSTHSPKMDYLSFFEKKGHEKTILCVWPTLPSLNALNAAFFLNRAVSAPLIIWQ